MTTAGTWCLTCARLTLARAAALRCGEYDEATAADRDLRQHWSEAHSDPS
ncbi:hypothetical protein ACH427_26440 [Streptomyces sp. NPDC020379]